MRLFPYLISTLLVLISCTSRSGTSTGNTTGETRRTKLTIEGEKVLINDVPTLKGKIWNGIEMEGLLPNSRMVQGIFDDLNPETAGMWVYPDSHVWDPERNTREFVSAMDSWREQGLLGFTINLQGGSPQGYSSFQPWYNSAIDSSGNLREDYMMRLEKILDKSDQLGMVTILGIFYFGQDEHVMGEEAIKSAVRNTIRWLAERKYSNIIIEIANECNNKSYESPIIQAGRIDELIRLAQDFSAESGIRYPVGASFNGNTLPSPNVVKASDIILLHGNGVKDPARIAEMVAQTRLLDEYHPMPIIFNEDDHFDFDKEDNNMIEAFKAGASWGFFDFRMKGEGYHEGFQSVPVDWTIGSERKKAFFGKLKEIEGAGE